jgi:hypothetical protein
VSTVVDKATFTREWRRYADRVRDAAAGRIDRPTLIAPKLEIRGTTTATRTTTARTHRPVITFAALAMDVLRSDWLYDDGTESSCGLYGVRHDNGDITVWNVGRFHSDGRQGQVRLPLDELREDGAGYLRGPGWQLVGDLHVHPTFRPDGIEASKADRDSWRSYASRVGDSFAGVILGPSSDAETRWLRPYLKGWIAERGGKLTWANVSYSWD